MSVALSRRVLLVGGTSEIGLAIVRRLAQEGPVSPVLLGRDQARLEAALELLHASGCTGGGTALLQAEELDAHERVISQAFAGAGGFDVVIMAVGVLVAPGRP